jgi:hypothetical protein
MAASDPGQRAPNEAIDQFSPASLQQNYNIISIFVYFGDMQCIVLSFLYLYM